MQCVRPLTAKASLAVAMLVALFLNAPVQAQALNQVPDDALVVLKVRNLEQMSQKVAKFAKGLGLDQQEPKLNDPLTAIAEEAQMSKGLSRGGDMVIAYLDAAKYGGNDEESVLVLVPTNDYKAFLTNFKSTADAGAGISKATPQKGSKDLFVANWGAYAAMSPAQAVLAKKPTGLKLSGLAMKESDGKDALVYVNVKSLRGKILPELKNGREQMLAEIERGLDAENAGKFKPLAKVAANTLVNLVEQFLNEAHSATLSLNLSDAGIGTTVAADFEPTSTLGKMMLQTKPAEGGLLAGLPDRKYFFFGGAKSDPEVGAKLVANLLDPIIKEMAGVPETAKFVPALESAKKAYAATTGWSIGYVAPTGALGQESVIQQLSVIRGDSKVILDSQRQMMTSMNDIMQMMPKQEGQSVSFQMKPDAKTIAGVKFDSFETKMTFPQDDPQAEQVKQMMAFIYGPQGMSGVLGAIDGKTVVSSQGASDELITDLVTAAKANADALSAQASVRSVSAELPKNRTAEFYFDLGTLVSTSARYAKGFNVPVNVKLPADLPPIGFSAGADTTAVRMDMHVPNKLIQGLMSAYLQAMRDMQGPDGGL